MAAAAVAVMVVVVMVTAVEGKYKKRKYNSYFLIYFSGYPTLVSIPTQQHYVSALKMEAMEHLSHNSQLRSNIDKSKFVLIFLLYYFQ